MDMQFEVFAKIQKPVATVFNAVYQPDQLSRYFTTGGASGPLAGGSTVYWEFADHPGAFPVQILHSDQNSRIVLEWDSSSGNGERNRVEITFIQQDEHHTQVRISESGWQENQSGLKHAYMNCMGWTQMLCCLKAWLEHGVNLREGYF